MQFSEQPMPYIQFFVVLQNYNF